LQGYRITAAVEASRKDEEGESGEANKAITGEGTEGEL